jgi:hypothetical protein
MSGILADFPFTILGERLFVWANLTIVKKKDSSPYFWNSEKIVIHKYRDYIAISSRN